MKRDKRLACHNRACLWEDAGRCSYYRSKFAQECQARKTRKARKGRKE